MKKLRVAILFGGKSAEHEVSVQSAKNIYTSIDKNKYEVVVIGIDKEGNWYLSSGEQLIGLPSTLPNLQEKAEPVFLIEKGKQRYLVSTLTNEDRGSIDVVFPVLH